MRRAAAVDGNQGLIVRVLRAIGASVQSIAPVGDGCPDLLVGWRRQTFLLEVKDPAQAPSARRLTELELRWHRTWNGLPVAVVHTPEEALQAIGANPVQQSSPDGKGEPDGWTARHKSRREG